MVDDVETEYAGNEDVLKLARANAELLVALEIGMADPDFPEAVFCIPVVGEDAVLEVVVSAWACI